MTAGTHAEKARSTAPDSEAGSIESCVLRQCGRHVLSNSAPARTKSVLRDDLDWESAIEFATRHKVGLVLFESLRERPRQELPTDISEALEARLNTTRIHNLSMVAELVAIVNFLESNGVRVIPYKGPVIASRAYGDVSCRRFVDLDLLVDPADRRRAISLLEERGYEQRTVYEHLSETGLKNPEKNIQVDLHTSVVPDDFPFHIAFDELYDRRTLVDVGGESVPAFSTTDAIIVHSIHGSKHCWFRAEWILAVATLLDHEEDISMLLERAEDVGCDRMVLLAMVLSRRFFDASFPQPIERRLDGQSKSMNAVRAAADEVPKWTHTTEWAADKGSHLAGLRLQARLCPDIVMKLRFVTDVLTAPQENDFDAVSLPEPLSPLYRVVRPLRLLYHYRGAIADQLR